MPPTRERILDAAATVLRERGIPGATTKEIARVAGCSEGTLYNHFADKQALVVAVASERLPSLMALARELPGRAGTRTVRAHLHELATVALAFFADILPMAAPVLANPDLLAAHQRRMVEEGVGPHVALAGFTRYLENEQRLGRVRGSVQARAAVALLLGACHNHAFLRQFAPLAVQGIDDDEFAGALVDTLLAGLSPAEAEEG